MTAPIPQLPDLVPDLLDWPIANKIADLREEPCDRVGLNKFLGTPEDEECCETCGAPSPDLCECPDPRICPRCGADEAKVGNHCWCEP